MITMAVGNAMIFYDLFVGFIEFTSHFQIISKRNSLFTHSHPLKARSMKN